MFKLLRIWLLRIITFLAVLLSISAILVIIYEFGYPQDGSTEVVIGRAYNGLLIGLWILLTLRFVLSGPFSSQENSYTAARIAIYAVFTLVVLSVLSVRYHVLHMDSFLSFVTGHWSIVVTLFLISLIELSRFVTALLGKRTNPAMVIASGFAMIIFIGSLLLGLPNCSVSGLSYIDSLFLSTSAVCVTGLTPVDLSQTLTTSGFVVLLILIQIGGLGIMTLTSFFGLFFTGQSFAGQIAVSDLVSSDKITGLMRFLLRIIIVTVTVEAIGALFIYMSLINNTHMAHGEALFFAIFHAVSAFCNAGFSTLTGNLYDPAVRDISSVIWVVSWLVIFGGIGFPIFSNALHIAGHKLRNLFRRIIGRRAIIQPHLWSLNSFIVIRTTIIILSISWCAMLALEWNHSLAGYAFWDKFSQGFLMAVTPRTAGFNGVDLTSMLPASIFITMILMWIGGAPQSTAGGIKVTTIYLALRNIIGSQLNEPIELRGREIPAASLRRALGVVVCSMLIIATATIAMSLLEPTVDLIRLLFEVISALGTVGLSLGLTPDLSDASKLIDIALMFIGRIGIVSIIAIFIKRHTKTRNYSYPEENILIS